MRYTTVKKIKGRIMNTKNIWLSGFFCLSMFGLWERFAYAGQYSTAKITAYCSCVKCCGKSDGITASGHKLKTGDKVIACNWLKFGTKVHIAGLGVYTVRDRGAKSHFGTFKNPIEHFDIWMPKHHQARKFGVQYFKYEIVK